MFTGFLIPINTGQAVQLAGFVPALAALIFNSLCRSTTANAHANESCRVSVPPMPIASVVSGFCKKKEKDKKYENCNYNSWFKR
jgi:hypothetical protein